MEMRRRAAAALYCCPSPPQSLALRRSIGARLKTLISLGMPREEVQSVKYHRGIHHFRRDENAQRERGRKLANNGDNLTLFLGRETLGAGGAHD